MSTHRAPRRCGQCQQPVLYWRNANRDDRYLKVDPSSDESGTVQKLVNADGIWGKRLTGPELAGAVASGEMLFTLHSTTCSARRKPNPKPEGLEIPGLTTRNRR